MRTAAIMVLVAVAAPLAGAGSAGAAELVFEHRFTSVRPGDSTGMTSHIVYPDYSGKPKPVARLIVSLAAGTRFDQAVVPTCTASDADLLFTGLSACPARSGLGGGTGTVVTGFGPPVDPIHGDLHLFHGPGQLMNVGTPPGSDRVLVVGRGRIQGATIVYTPPNDTPYPALGGPPDGRTAGKEVRLTLRERSSGGRGFLVTPDTCPSSGTWTFQLTAIYEDGGSDSATSASPCSREAKVSMALRVKPRRVRVGQGARFRFRVRSFSPSCRGGVRIRFAGKTLHTGKNGRASLVAALDKPRRYRAKARKSGCMRAWASVRALPQRVP